MESMEKTFKLKPLRGLYEAEYVENGKIKIVRSRDEAISSIEKEAELDFCVVYVAPAPPEEGLEERTSEDLETDDYFEPYCIVFSRKKGEEGGYNEMRVNGLPSEAIKKAKEAAGEE